ncbi:hypothetical protein GJ496_008347 [Pomphorhynchus laevis]|nr:hypothetical protein GJ496_008347 [Pomphorhynchus laevis]
MMYCSANIIYRRCLSTFAKVSPIYEQALLSIKDAGTYKNERIITSPQSAKITVSSSKDSNKSDRVLNFCANNYLGLCDHPDVIKASKDYIDKYGAGLSSVRFICGTQDIHKQLEYDIAKFHKRDDAILFSSCFDANGGVFEVMLGPEDAVVSDELNHASIIDGLRLCKAKKSVYKNKDMADLDAKLTQAADARIKLIVTDGVFSMDGAIAPLPEIIELARKHNSLTYMDECHATGFLGKTGRGTEEFWDVIGKIDVISSTLGKALGGASGGYITGHQPIIDLLRQRARPYLFSNTLAPPLVGSARSALRLITEKPEILKNMRANVDLFRTGMKKAKFNVIGHPQHPICPVMLGDASLASKFADNMLEEGIYVIGFSFPVVPKGKARIRVQISAAHSQEEIEHCLKAFEKVGKKLNVI